MGTGPRGCLGFGLWAGWWVRTEEASRGIAMGLREAMEAAVWTSWRVQVGGKEKLELCHMDGRNHAG